MAVVDQLQLDCRAVRPFQATCHDQLLAVLSQLVAFAQLAAARTLSLALEPPALPVSVQRGGAFGRVLLLAVLLQEQRHERRVTLAQEDGAVALLDLHQERRMSEESHRGIATARSAGGSSLAGLARSARPIRSAVPSLAATPPTVPA